MKMKRVISAILTAVMIISTFLGYAPTANAAGNLTEEQFSSKISELKSIYRNGEYWNSYNSCGYEGTGSAICPTQSCRNLGYCGGTTGSGCPCVCGAYVEGGKERAWQCMGFAYKMGYLLFGYSPYSGSWSQSYNSNAELFAGDIVRINNNRHSVIITKVTSTTVYYADCNRTGPCRVSWDGSYSISDFRGRITWIKHFSGNTLKGTGSSSSTSYASITPGVYYLKNKATGEYLIVDAGVDANKQNISVWPWADANEMKFEITATTTGYKMRPLCSSARLVNAWGSAPSSGANVNLYDDCSESSQWWQFEATDGGYYIHNVFASNCVLDTDGRNVLIENKHGGASQIWYLEPMAHDCNKGEFMYFWKSHPHYNCYKCSICGTIWEDRTEENIIESCTECIAPPLPSIIDPGDTNSDGSINLADVSSLLMHIAKWDIEINTDAADVTGDGEINLSDVSLILQYIANWDVVLK